MLLSGHHQAGAGVINGTIIEPGDVMARLTDPDDKQWAVWQSQRLKLVRKWSDHHDDLWMDRYADLRSSYPTGDPGARSRAEARATEFYRQNRAAMDAGCDVAWEWCFTPPGEVSAVQHAYNLLIDLGEAAFEAECNNNPPEQSHDYVAPPAQAIARKQHGLAPCVSPHDAVRLTAFIDQQDELLYWLVAAWLEGLIGYVLDYGSFPSQRKRYFTLATATKKLSTVYPGMSEDARIHAGLTALCRSLTDKRYFTPAGEPRAIDRIGVDVGYGVRTQTIYNWMEQSPHRSQLVACKGYGIGATKAPMAEWGSKPGDERGNEWILRRVKQMAIRRLMFETNYHKKATIDGLVLPVASPGTIALPKSDPELQTMIGDHVNAEYGELDESGDRKVLVMKQVVGRDNHFFDTLVGARVIACSLRVPGPGERTKRRRGARKRKTRRSRPLS